MGRTFSIEKYPFDDSTQVFKKSKITLNSGVTILVGCNGIGKSTLMRRIKSVLSKENVPVFMYDNLTEGAGYARTKSAFYGQWELFSAQFSASEGEAIFLNLCAIAGEIGAFVQNNENVDELWILFDAIDSGLSIDQIREVKEDLIHFIYNYIQNNGIEPYIIVSANEYEMCIDENCFDIAEGKYRRFKTYDAYSKCVMQSRDLKNLMRDK